MAEGAASELVDPSATASTAAADMDIENVESGESPQKRARDEEENDAVSKKQKVDEEEKSVEEQRLEKKLVEQEEENKVEGGEEEEEEKEPSGPVKLGPKSFESSSEMFGYFYNLLHVWPPYLNVNKYEHMMLLELLKKGHAVPAKKIGQGIRAFQVRKHPTYKSRCFFLIREDNSVDDFSFRKCVGHILPLPEEMHLKSDMNKASGGGGGKHHGGKVGRGRGGSGGGHGHGRRGRWRH